MTSALFNEDVDNAVILAEYLRRAESSRVVGIAYSQKNLLKRGKVPDYSFVFYITLV